MVAAVRCEEISNEKFSRLTSDEVAIFSVCLAAVFFFFIGSIGKLFKEYTNPCVCFSVGWSWRQLFNLIQYQALEKSLAPF